MKEKELKIKQKSDFIKTRKREIFDIKEKPVNLFNNRLKSDLIKKTVTEKKEQAEKATNEASVQAEEKIENTVINTGLYVADTVIPNIIKSKKGNFQKYESNLTYTDRNSSKKFDNNEVKEVLRYRQEVLDDMKMVNKINPDYIKISEYSLSGNTADTINAKQSNTPKNETEPLKLRENGVLKTKLIDKKDTLTEPREEKNHFKSPLNFRINYQKVKNIKLNNNQKILPIHNQGNEKTIPKTYSNYRHTDIKQKDFTNHNNETRFQSNSHTKTKQHGLLLHKNHKNRAFLKRNSRTVKNQNLQGTIFQRSQIKKKILLNTKKITVKTTSSTIKVGKRATMAIAKTAAAVVKGIALLLSSMGGAVVVFVIIAAVLALMTTAFGVFYSPFDDTEGTKRIAQIVAETNSEFNNRISEIENNVKHDNVEYHSDNDNHIFVTNWTQVVAVFAVKTSGDTEQALDVVTIDNKREELLKEVFWDMNIISYDTEKITSDEKEETILHISLESKSYTDMIDIYDFTPYQEQSLEELMKPEYAQMLSELVGTIGVTGGDITLTPEQITEMLENLPEDLLPERKAVMEAAYSLVGKVNYFWGGKSSAIGWDSRWGTLTKVTAAGSIDTGTTRPFGLDCSGFVTWAFINATGDTSYANIIGHGAANQYSRCEKIDWSEAQAGDLVFYPDLGHVGIIAGTDDNGNLLVVHCASSQNNVVVTGLQGFTKIGRPALFN